jgi:hypothetical protein
MSRPALKMSERDSVRTMPCRDRDADQERDCRPDRVRPLAAAMSFTARRQSHGTLMARVVAATRQTTPAPNRTL